jgi:predicted transcriptional regulator
MLISEADSGPNSLFSKNLRKFSLITKNFVYNDFMSDLTAWKKPTDAELSILQVLWSRGEATVREVHDELGQSRKTGYTTILKLMQIMSEKGLVKRVETGKAHVYRPAQPQEVSQQSLVGDLIDKAFGGSASSLVMRALSSKPATPEELAEIRKMLDALEDPHG